MDVAPPQITARQRFSKNLLCVILCACARACVCVTERRHNAFTVHTSPHWLDKNLSALCAGVNHTLITTEPAEVWWDRNMSWLTLGCHTSTWSIHSLTPHFKYLYTLSVLFSQPNWTPWVPSRLRWGSLDTSTVLDLSRCPCTCLHLSSAPFLSPSACSARSMAFSLSNFSICIFFLMASMVPPRVLSPQQGYPDRDGGRCGLEHT